MFRQTRLDLRLWSNWSRRGDTAVVNTYDYLRYQYSAINSGFIRTALVDDKKFIHPAVLAVDPYALKCNYGLQASFTDIQQD